MRLALLPLFLAPLVSALSPPANYINTAVARTVELVGSFRPIWDMHVVFGTRLYAGSATVR